MKSHSQSSETLLTRMSTTAKGGVMKLKNTEELNVKLERKCAQNQMQFII
jgi:hypothetical protein